MKKVIYIYLVIVLLIIISLVSGQNLSELDNSTAVQENISENFTETNITNLNITSDYALPENNSSEQNSTLELNTSDSELNNSEIGLSEENSSFAIEENETLEESNSVAKEPKMAVYVNDESINTPYIRQYLGWYKNFSKEISQSQTLFSKELDISLKLGYSSDNIRSVSIDNNYFVLHLIHCSRGDNLCTFRINGVVAKIHPDENFTLKNGYSLKLVSLKFGLCDERFCNRYFDAYDKVDVQVVNERVAQ